MTTTTPAAAPRAQSKPFSMSLKAKLGVLLGVLYVIYASAQLDVTLARFVAGLGHAATFLNRMFPPNFERYNLLIKGLSESLEIAVLASTLGIFLALPLGLLGARNLMPGWASWPARTIVAFCRALHPVIVAILFVKAVGFGALAGILALTVASIGFIGKLFTESIEEISLKQVEAVRATGASFANVIIFQFYPKSFLALSDFAPINLTPIFAIRLWSGLWVLEASVVRYFQHSNGLTTTMFVQF
jgi:phosphonate transport system permease protein